MDKEKIARAVRMILEAVGENPQREGLLDTPGRVADMYEEVLAGIAEDPKEHLVTQFTEDKHGEMVIIKNIPLYSLCEHHLMPFVGKAHVAYIPKDGVITGLSKVARVVEGYAKRLQLQERLTSQVADAIMKTLKPHGVLVIIEAEHMCMTMRGVEKPGSITITSAVRGILETRQTSRAEALALIKS
ncbi:MAG: GTP cyclohydrolase I FolE [Clostridiales bacterium]|nr:GTP cyclohydrolase I FolE [Clostridiales bacterium]